MGDPDIPALQRLIAELRSVIAVQRRAITDLDRQNRDLREAIDALLQPTPSELLAKNLAHPSRQ